MESQPRPRPTGTWIVLGMIALGVIAAGLAMTYWIGVDRRTWPQTQPGDAHAGAKPFDPKAAQQEVDAVQLQFNAAVNAKLAAQKVIDAARTVVEHYPRFAPARALMAQAYLYDMQLKEAYDQIAVALELESQNAEAQLIAGTVCMHLNRLEDAAKHYQMAIGLDPKNARFRLHQAQLYVHLGDVEKAQMTILEAINLDTSSYEAYALLADVHAKQGKLSLAIGDITRAIERAPVSKRRDQVVYIRQKAMFLRRDNRPDEAIIVLNDTLTDAERLDADVIEDMAVCWAMLNKPANAATLYEKAQVETPDDWRLYDGAARWWIKANSKIAAERQLELLRRVAPRRPEVARLDAQIKAMK